MINKRRIEQILSEGKLISDIDFHSADKNTWQFSFVYKGKQDYRFSVETSNGKQAIGFYNYDKETDKCGACIGAIYLGENFDLEKDMNKLIKQFQLEHVFKDKSESK